MSRNPKAAEISLDYVWEFGDLLLGRPYLWTVFFKADGSTLAVTDAGVVAGNCKIYPSTGSHGSLGSQPPTATTQKVPYYVVGDNGSSSDEITMLSWSVAEDLGLWASTILPIPVAQSLQGLVGPDKPGVFGLVAVLMNDGGHVPEHAMEAGHSVLNSEVENGINSLLRTLQLGHESITDEDVNAVIEGIPPKVKDAVTNAMSGSEKLWALSGSDVEIVHAFWRWDQDQIESASFTVATGPNKWGDWSHWAYYGIRMDDFAVTGNTYVTSMCPADAFEYLLNSFFDAIGETSASSSSFPWPEAMRKFRDEGEFDAYPGLRAWWDVLARYVPHVIGVGIRDKRFRLSLRMLLNDLQNLLNERDGHIPEEFLRNAEYALRTVCKSPHSELRKAAIIGLALLRRTSGVTVAQALRLAARIGPSGNTRVSRSESVD
jgi:hypothetical protein